ncbi:MAG: hypothetical protein R3B06_21220 [Kofleriaceae bacterium]
MAICLLLGTVACGGILDEDSSTENPLLNEVPPPDCADVATAGDGHHRPGEDCLSCHRQGGDGTPFTFGGTLYTDQGGTAPAPGITIHIKDGAGGDAVAVTATNGNFWGTDPVAAPAVAFIATCPDVIPMQAALASADGTCNRSGCHTEGFRVHP